MSISHKKEKKLMSKFFKTAICLNIVFLFSDTWDGFRWKDVSGIKGDNPIGLSVISTILVSCLCIQIVDAIWYMMPRRLYYGWQPKLLSYKIIKSRKLEIKGSFFFTSSHCFFWSCSYILKFALHFYVQTSTYSPNSTCTFLFFFNF